MNSIYVLKQEIADNLEEMDDIRDEVLNALCLDYPITYMQADYIINQAEKECTKDDWCAILDKSRSLIESFLLLSSMDSVLAANKSENHMEICRTVFAVRTEETGITSIAAIKLRVDNKETDVRKAAIAALREYADTTDGKDKKALYGPFSWKTIAEHVPAHILAKKGLMIMSVSSYNVNDLHGINLYVDLDKPLL